MFIRKKNRVCILEWMIIMNQNKSACIIRYLSLTIGMQTKNAIAGN
jgi:hypothetical protein